MTERNPLFTLTAIHLPCTLEVASHLFFIGETQKLSKLEAAVHVPSLAVPGNKPPPHGASCLLTLNIPRSGVMQPEILKIPCQVVYIVSIIIHLNLNAEDLNSRQHNIFDALLTDNLR